MKKIVAKINFILIFIMIIGGFFRFYNLNWDQNQHLHPDERFLTMVGNAMKIPNNFFSYLDPKISLINPTNIGYGFFVYGVFPLTLNKIIAVGLGNDSYNNFTIQGRFLSGLFDFLIIFLVYATVKLLEKQFNLKPSLKYIASFLYAISVLPIQLSHFFTVDTFLNFFTFASFYFALRFYVKQRTLFILISAFLVGLAISSKASGIFILPLNLLLIILPYIKNLLTKKLKIIAFLLLYFIVLYFSTRIFDPYLFKNSNPFDLSINTKFLESIASLNSLANKDAWFPPSVQWINKLTIWYSLYNMALFGLGLPISIFSFIGTYYIIRSRKILPILLNAWALLFFFYQSTRFVQTMRYFLILYPFMAILATLGFVYSMQKAHAGLRVSIVILLLIWPLAFFSIYTKDHSRIDASKWIYENISSGEKIVWEHWDDPLPLLLSKYSMQYSTEQLPVFDPDTPEKIQNINKILVNTDYYVLSSNRAWGSIPTVPERYPLSKKFYEELFAEKRGFVKIKEFTSYPSLRYLGIPIDFPDDWSEEAFTVYDHPKVIIFKKN